VFGYHVTGSTGTLFLAGIVVGGVALAGLSLLLAGARRTARRGRAARSARSARPHPTRAAPRSFPPVPPSAPSLLIRSNGRTVQSRPHLGLADCRPVDAIGQHDVRHRARER